MCACVVLCCDVFARAPNFATLSYTYVAVSILSGSCRMLAVVAVLVVRSVVAPAGIMTCNFFACVGYNRIEYIGIALCEPS